jgi:hypothetical protein
MRYLTSLVVGIALLTPVAAAAQDFGVAQSAETINRGNIKVFANPILIFGKDGSENEGGFAFGIGYAPSSRYDIEGKIAIFDNVKFYGGDVEFELSKSRKYNLSATIGAHLTDTDFDNWGAVDVTLEASRHVAPKLEVYGALDMAFEKPPGDSYQTFHLVPGIEYAISDELDFDAEFGIGLNHDSHHYLTAGLSYYFR